MNLIGNFTKWALKHIVAHLTAWDGSNDRSVACNTSGYLRTTVEAANNSIGGYSDDLTLTNAAQWYSQPWKNHNTSLAVGWFIQHLAGVGNIDGLRLELSSGISGSGAIAQVADVAVVIGPGESFYTPDFVNWNTITENCRTASMAHRVSAMSAAGGVSVRIHRVLFDL